MGGFEYTTFRPALRLVFDDQALAGLEIVMRRPNVDESMFIGQFYATDHKKAPRERQQADLDRLYEIVAGRMIEWNMEIDGKPVPPTVQGVREIDGGLLGTILGAWLKGAAMVSAPLGPTSSDGEDSAVALESIPMEVSSPNHTN
jgi:hypothetical protein